MAVQRQNKILCFVVTCNHKLLHVLINVIKEIENAESDDDNYEEALLNRNIQRIRGKQ